MPFKGYLEAAQALRSQFQRVGATSNGSGVFVADPLLPNTAEAESAGVPLPNQEADLGWTGRAHLYPLPWRAVPEDG